MILRGPPVPESDARRDDATRVESGRDQRPRLEQEEPAIGQAATSGTAEPAAAAPLVSAEPPPTVDEAQAPPKKGKGKDKREPPPVPVPAGPARPVSRWPWATIIRIGVVVLAVLIAALAQHFGGQPSVAPSPTATPAPPTRAPAAVIGWATPAPLSVDLTRSLSAAGAAAGSSR
jgi:hypothetical protein